MTTPQDNPMLLQRRRKLPFLAGLLSLLPGLGQIYVGYYRRGFTQVLLVAAVMTILASESIVDGLEPFFGMFIAFLWLYSVIDAWRLANLYNDALAGLGPEDLRQELAQVGRRGSIAGGAVVILVSFLALLHTRFGMPLDWLRDWWPLAPIGFGVYLLWQGIQDRRK